MKNLAKAAAMQQAAKTAKAEPKGLWLNVTIGGYQIGGLRIDEVHAKTPSKEAQERLLLTQLLTSNGLEEGQVAALGECGFQIEVQARNTGLDPDWELDEELQTIYDERYSS